MANESELGILVNEGASQHEADTLSEVRPEVVMPLVEVDFVRAPSPEEHRIWAARGVQSELRGLRGGHQRPGGRVI